MSRFVRQSKVRHVYADPPKEEVIYKGFKLSSATGDHSYIKANTKYIAIPVYSANGSLTIIDQNIADRRLATGSMPVLDGHRGPVLDFDFNPFQEQLVATGGDDCVTKVWGIPPEGLKDSISEALLDLVGHDKKVTSVLHHPTAEFVLATGSADRTVKFWDIEKQMEVASADHGEMIQGLAWDSQGEILASTCRDKKCRVLDPRTGSAVHELAAHDGQRTMKVVFCPNKGPGNGEAICTVGFTRQAKRQFKLWDQRQLSKAYATQNLDQAAGALLPFYDEATNLLYLAGKGDANIRYYELVDGNPWQFFISEYRSKKPCRGMTTLPKRAVDTTKTEIMRFLKLCANEIIPLSFTCPRKNTMFQADLYPDAYAGKAGVKADDFFAGKKGNVIKVSMDPGKKGKISSSGSKAGSKAGAGFAKKKTMAELNRELNAAKNEIEKLKALLKANGIDH